MRNGWAIGWYSILIKSSKKSGSPFECRITVFNLRIKSSFRRKRIISNFIDLFFFKDLLWLKYLIKSPGEIKKCVLCEELSTNETAKRDARNLNRITCFKGLISLLKAWIYNSIWGVS